MKKILITLSALAMGTAVASAADLPVYKSAPPPAVVAPLYNWSGFYLGLNGGGGSTHKCWDLIATDGIPLTAAEPEGCHNATGGTVGGQIGYRWQATNWVFGVEAQGNWADFTGSNISQALFFDNLFVNHTKMDAFGLFTGQIGWAWNNILFYVKGGAAVVNDNYTTVVNAAGAGAPLGTLLTNVSGTHWGGTVGAGLEFGFAPGWSVGVEYDHIFLGTTSSVQNFLPPFTPADSVTRNINQNVDMGLVRVNYTFFGYGGYPPVVSRY
jgi:outer membrane immunogenic protein